MREVWGFECFQGSRSVGIRMQLERYGDCNAFRVLEVWGLECCQRGVGIVMLSGS